MFSSQKVLTRAECILCIITLFFLIYDIYRCSLDSLVLTVYILIACHSTCQNIWVCGKWCSLKATKNKNIKQRTTLDHFSKFTIPVQTDWANHTAYCWARLWHIRLDFLWFYEVFFSKGFNCKCRCVQTPNRLLRIMFILDDSAVNSLYTTSTFSANPGSKMTWFSYSIATSNSGDRGSRTISDEQFFINI